MSIRKACLIVPVIVGMFIYFPILMNGFVWDDHQFFEDNTFFSYARSNDLFFSRIPLWENKFFYRPLTQILFFFQYRSGHGQPWIFHLVSIIVFSANCILIMGIVYKTCALKNEKLTAEGLIPELMFWAGIFYVVHPAMVETVSWISSQFDLQMTFWLLMLFFVSFFKKSEFSSFFYSLLLFFCACSSKEMSVFFPLVFLGLHYVLVAAGSEVPVSKIKFLQSRRADMLGMLIGGSIYLVIRSFCLPGNPISIFNVGLTDLYLEAVRSFFWYAKLTVAPFYGIGMHFKDAYEYSSFWYAVGGSLLLLCVVFFLRAYTAAGIIGACYFVALAPALLTVTAGYSATFVNDRYLSYPLAILIAQIPALAVSLREYMKKMSRHFMIFMRVIFLLLVAYLALYSQGLARAWKSDLTVWSNALETNPASQYARSQVVDAYAHAGFCEKAEDVARKKPESTITTIIVIARCRIQKNPEYAIEQMQALLAMPATINEHDFYNVLTTLAMANVNLGRYDKAVEIYNDILAAYPSKYKIHMSLSEVYLQACKERDAQREFNLAISFVPESARAVWKESYQKLINQYGASCGSVVR